MEKTRERLAITYTIAAVAIFALGWLMYSAVKTNTTNQEPPNVITGVISAIGADGTTLRIKPTSPTAAKSWWPGTPQEVTGTITTKTQLFKKMILPQSHASVIPASDLVSIPYTDLSVGSSVTVTPIRESIAANPNAFELLVVTIEP